MMMSIAARHYLYNLNDGAGSSTNQCILWFNREITTKDDIRNISHLLGGRKVPFDTLLRPTRCARTTLPSMLSLYIKFFRSSVPDTTTFDGRYNNKLPIAAGAGY